MADESVCVDCDDPKVVTEWPEPLCRVCVDDRERMRVGGDPDREVDR